MLEAIDSAMQSIQTQQARSGADHRLEHVEIPATQFTQVEQGWLQWAITQDVLMPRRLEGIVGGAAGAVPIFPGELDDRDRIYWNEINSSPRWHLIDNKRTLAIFGLAQFETYRLWFERRYPPCHYGVGAAGGSTGTIKFDTAATLRGRVVKRSDVYVGMQIEFDPSAADADKIVTITAWDGSIATFTPAVGSTTVGQAYSLLVPVDPEFATHLSYRAALHLASNAANVELIQSLTIAGQAAAEDFDATITAQQSAAPRRLHSSRG